MKRFLITTIFLLLFTPLLFAGKPIAINDLVELGRLLAARFMVFGELIDMGQQILISMKEERLVFNLHGVYTNQTETYYQTDTALIQLQNVPLGLLYIQGYSSQFLELISSL